MELTFNPSRIKLSTIERFQIIFFSNLVIIDLHGHHDYIKGIQISLSDYYHSPPEAKGKIGLNWCIVLYQCIINLKGLGGGDG